jgi:hypothetical protein
VQERKDKKEGGGHGDTNPSPEEVLIAGLRILQNLRKSAGCDVSSQPLSNILDTTQDFCLSEQIQGPITDCDYQWQLLLSLLSPEEAS